MNYRKVDAGLARALSTTSGTEETPFSVFVRTTAETGEEEAAVLADIGCRGVAPGAKIYTAELSPQRIGELSEKPWIHSITLSRTSRPLPEDG